MKIKIIYNDKTYTLFETTDKNIIINLNTFKNNIDRFNNLFENLVVDKGFVFYIELEINNIISTKEIKFNDFRLNEHTIDDAIKFFDKYIVPFIREITRYEFKYDLASDNFYNIKPYFKGDFSILALNTNSIDERGYKMISIHTFNQYYFI